MKRRELIVGAASVAGLAAANKVLADQTVVDQAIVNPAPVPAGGGDGKATLTEVTVLALYQETQKSDAGKDFTTPVVVLKARDGESYLPIWIGAAEGISISLALDGNKPLRPMSHDLMVKLVEALGGQITAISIRLGAQNIYYATLKVTANGHETEIDSRPSDALALALRLKSPIWVATELLRPMSLDELKAELGQK